MRPLASVQLNIRHYIVDILKHQTVALDPRLALPTDYEKTMLNQ